MLMGILDNFLFDIVLMMLFIFKQGEVEDRLCEICEEMQI